MKDGYGNRIGEPDKLARWFAGTGMFTIRRDDRALAALLERASKRELTQAERDAQRLSFVYGNLPIDSPLTKAEVRAYIEADLGRKLEIDE